MTKVGLIFGGKSHEHEVSKLSALAFLKQVDYQEFTVQPFYIPREGEWLVYDFVTQPISDLSELTKKTVSKLVAISYLKEMDVVFPLIHGDTGEDGRLQGLLEMLDLQYVGCNVESSALGMNKAIAKELVALHGDIPVVPSKAIRKKTWNEFGNNLLQEIKDYPLFVKPVRAGSSVGITKVYNETDLIQAVNHAFQIDDEILIEKSIEAREIEIGVIGREEIEISVPGEITYESDFYDYENKYHTDTSKMHIPAELNEEQIQTIQKYATKVYEILHCQDYARIDFFLDKQTGEIYFNEINTSPGFTEKSMFPSLFADKGYAFQQLLTKIIRYAIPRGKKTRIRFLKRKR